MGLDWGKWLYGVVAAFIGGGSSAITSGLAAIGIDPDHFNLNNGLRHTATLAGTVFVVSGGISAFAFLKQSPLPTSRDIWTDEQRAAAAAKPHPLPDAAPKP